MLYEIFRNILISSVIGSVFILLIVLLSNIIDKKYKIKWRYYIWIVLAIYLLIPFDLSIEKPLLNVNMPEIIVREINNRNEKPINTEIVNNEMLLNQDIKEENIIVNTENNSKYNIVQEETQNINKLNIKDIIIGIWLIGIVIFTIYYIYIYRKFRKNILVANSEVLDNEILDIFNSLKEEYNIKNNIDIKINNSIKSPVVLGLFKKELLLPNINLDIYKYNMIIRHELIHIKRNDILYKFIIILSRGVHWFNPFVHLMGKKANEDIEITCDLEVVENMSEEYKKDYSNTILDIAGNDIEDYIFTTNFSGGKSTLKNRFENILSGVKKKSRFIGIIIITIILSITFLVSCSGKDNTVDIVKDFDKNHIYYENNDFGIALKLPSSWEDKYDLIEEVDTLYFINKKIYNKLEDKNYISSSTEGILFSINRLQGNLYDLEDLKRIATQNIKLIGDNIQYTYYYGDLSGYNTEITNTNEEYKNMINDLDVVKDNIMILDNPKVETINRDYQKIGNIFLKGEIPDDWDIGYDKNNDYKFNFYKDKKTIGYMESIPLDAYDFKRENGYMDYILKDENRRTNSYNKLRISILEEYKVEMDNIIDTIELLNNLSSIEKRNKEIRLHILDDYPFINEKPKMVIGKIEDVYFDKENRGNSYIEIKYFEENMEKVEKIYISEDTNTPIIPIVNGQYGRYGEYNFDENYYNEHLDLKDKTYEIYLSEYLWEETKDMRIKLLVETDRYPIDLIKADSELYNSQLEAIMKFNSKYLPEEIQLTDIYYVEDKDGVDEKMFYQELEDSNISVRYIVDSDNNIKLYKLDNYIVEHSIEISSNDITNIGKNFMDDMDKTYYFIKKDDDNINHISGNIVYGNLLKIDGNTGEIIYYSENNDYQIRDAFFQKLNLKD